MFYQTTFIRLQRGQFRAKSKILEGKSKFLHQTNVKLFILIYVKEERFLDIVIMIKMNKFERKHPQLGINFRFGIFH